jgi:general secretion pathway protein J
VVAEGQTVIRRKIVPQQGFTLIEVLVALALMAMIATILIVSLQIGGHTWQRVTRSTTHSDDIARAQAFLREHLSALYPAERQDSSGERPAFLLSDGRSVEFTSYAPYSAAAGMLRYRILVAARSGLLEVESRVDTFGSSDFVGTDWAAEGLVSHVSSFAIHFWAQPPDEPGQWVDQWTDTAHIPPLVKIDVGFPPGDNRRWPSLYIAPRVDTPVTCEFDLVSRQCRGGR